ncbi:MAG: periplasmic heavy metal sensor [Gammaproteobacteria bacterium]|nr:periplasmic heavy metal sensor [Gammaproteobacteria bacterium]
MKTKTKQGLFTILTAFAAIAFIASSSIADTPAATDENNTGQMMYPGMPGGMGPGNMGYGRMGPGMGQMGPGYMGQNGMGPGYMHQRGMGPGMGYGDMGMMQWLNLDKSQRGKLRALMREQRAANCKTMTEMMDVRDELADEYDKDKPDAKAIGKLYEKMQGMQRQMLERMVETRNKMRDLLNKEQKEVFDRMHRGGMGPMGNGMMGNGMMGNGGMMNMME